MRPFRFGVMANDSLQLPTSGRAWGDFCRKVEDLGYSSVLLSDHLWPQLAPGPAIMAAADATTALRVGALMFCNDFRHPVMLAKEAATLDLLSDGRLELGIGAGWKDADYKHAGVPKASGKQRVDRLTEAIAILKGLFADGPFDFEGQHYRVTGLDSQPKPVQRPRPPLILGGGAPRVLSMAAREGDIVSINRSLRAGAVGTQARNNSSAAATDQKVQWIRDAAGDRFEELELNMVVPDLQITSNRRAEAERLVDRYDLEPEEVLQVPHLWLGTVDEICEDLQTRRDRWGVSYVVVIARDVEAAAPVVSRLAGT
jgi:probable F420-dependent oxidoreductase